MCTYTGVLLMASCVAAVLGASINEPTKNSKFKNPTLITEYENSKFENPSVDRENGRKLTVDEEDEQISNSKFKHPTVITADRNSKFENPVFFQVRARNLEHEEEFTNSKFKDPLLITPDRNSKFENPMLAEQNGRSLKFESTQSRFATRKQEKEVGVHDVVYEDEEFLNSKFLNPTLYDDEKSNSKFENSNAIDDKVIYVTFNESTPKRILSSSPPAVNDVRAYYKQSQERGIFKLLRNNPTLTKLLFPIRNNNNTTNNVFLNNKAILRPLMTGYLTYLKRHGAQSS